jgi:hypothetical protein
MVFARGMRVLALCMWPEPQYQSTSAAGESKFACPKASALQQSLQHTHMHEFGCLDRKKSSEAETLDDDVDDESLLPPSLEACHQTQTTQIFTPCLTMGANCPSL